MKGSIKIQLVFNVLMYTPLVFDARNYITVYYRSLYKLLNSNNYLSSILQEIKEDFNSWLDGFQERGSGFIFEKIEQTELNIVKTRSLKGSSYFKLNFRSNSLVNIQNEDQKCFLWCVLAHIHKIKTNPERVSKYKPFENEINMRRIDYPVKIKDIDKFENQNENISINVFSLVNNDLKTIYPLRISLENKTFYNIDLLYVEQDGNTHYCLIKKLESLLFNKVSYHKIYLCIKCFQTYSSQQALNNHQEDCSKSTLARAILPKEGTELKFKNYHYGSKLPFVIYCDFEALNKKIQTVPPNPKKTYTTPILKQEIFSYGMKIVSNYEDIIKSEYTSYIGEDAGKEYIEQLIEYFTMIYEKTKKINKIFLTKKEKEEFDNTNNCYMCNEELTKENKVIEHNHYDKKYRGAACQSCNTKEGMASKVIPVIFHNGSRFDFHFLIEELMKHEDKYNKVTVLAKNAEEYISIDFGNRSYKLRFLDSYRFLQGSLDDICKGIEDKDFKIMEQSFTKKEFNDLKYSENKQRSFKGIFPYEYIDDISKLKETQLPSFKKTHKKVTPWYSNLFNKDITKEEEQAKKIWKEFNCKTLKDYNDVYLKCDVLILADAFENFRNFFLKHHKIDPCYCYSAPMWNEI